MDSSAPLRGGGDQVSKDHQLILDGVVGSKTFAQLTIGAGNHSSPIPTTRSGCGPVARARSDRERVSQPELEILEGVLTTVASTGAR